MIDLVREYLGTEDDPGLWRLVLDTVFAELASLTASDPPRPPVGRDRALLALAPAASPGLPAPQERLAFPWTCN